MNKLQLENLSYRYAKNSRLILKDVNLTFTEGSVTAIVGESGAGKSTLLHLIAGLIEATPKTRVTLRISCPESSSLGLLIKIRPSCRCISIFP